MKAFSSVGGGVKGVSLRLEGGVICSSKRDCEEDIEMYDSTGGPAL